MSRPLRHVLVVGDRRRSGVEEGVQAHLDMLGRHLEVVDVDLDERVDLATARADLVLVFGGDGSILHVARRLGANPLPVLGVNYGRFGFLADLSPGDLAEGMSRVASGRYALQARARLAIAWRRAGQVLGEWLALNDVVVGHSELGRLVDVDVRIDGRHAIRCSGDGLIVATPTGSSAHAAAAGGPLLDPTLAGVVVVPIAPHALAMRPLVLAASHRLELEVSPSRAAAQFTVDGAAAREFAAGDVLEVVDANRPLTLVRVFEGPFFETLRTKLGWRGRPPYPQEGDTAGA